MKKKLHNKSMILAFIIALFCIQFVQYNKYLEINIVKNNFKETALELDIPTLFSNDEQRSKTEKANEHEKTKNVKKETTKKEEKEKIEDKNTENKNNSDSKKIQEQIEENKKKLNNIVPDDTKSELVNIKNKTASGFEKYKNKYNNSLPYAVTAYVLHLISRASIPICALIFAVSIIYQYVLGLNTKKIWNKGYVLRRITIWVFVVLQILPLAFAIIVKGWGN